jgi:hypothetical protein
VKNIILLLFLNTCVSAQEIVINESFSNNNLHWFTGKEGNSNLSINQGVYHVETTGIIKGLALNPPLAGGFFGGCTARSIQSSPLASYGFYLQHTGDDNTRIFFMLNNSGYYSVFTRGNDGITKPISKWTFTPYLNKESRFNTISIAGDSNSIKLYINDFYLSSFKNPCTSYNITGIAVIDSSVVEYDEFILFSFDKIENHFGIDNYNFPEVLSYLMDDKNDLRLLKGKPVNQDSIYESRLWIPGAHEAYIDDTLYTALFGTFTKAENAIASFNKLLDKIMIAFPDAIVDDGFDDNHLPYHYISRKVNDKYLNRFIDLSIYKQDNLYTVGIDIK